MRASSKNRIRKEYPARRRVAARVESGLVTGWKVRWSPGRANGLRPGLAGSRTHRQLSLGTNGDIRTMKRPAISITLLAAAIPLYGQARPKAQAVRPQPT